MPTALAGCPNCGASLRGASLRFCEYCGAALPLPPTPATHEQLRRDDRFQALRDHADFERLSRLEPDTAGDVLKSGARTAFAFVFLLVAVGIAAFFLSVSKDVDGAIGGVFSLIPIVVVIIGLVGFLRMLNHTRKLTAARLERAPALVVDKRTEVSGGGENSRARTHYFVTVEHENGSRRELEASGRIAGLVARDDLGVAYVKSDLLVDFQRLTV